MSRRNGNKLGMKGELSLKVERRSFGILCMWRAFARWERRKMWSMDRGRSLLQ